ncbi:hypothetical protein ASB62_01725 [Chlorobium limicola]|uniref:Uncharacterized protein n=1 Tax=Chlorobium limicola TaxID=1092 RepID=A0A101JT22_CHLLI|nr:hypothetical protein ASB62_01725 [Chlorobium limicola]
MVKRTTEITESGSVRKWIFSERDFSGKQFWTRKIFPAGSGKEFFGSCGTVSIGNGDAVANIKAKCKQSAAFMQKISYRTRISE